MKRGNLERKRKRRTKGEARNNLETERRARKQHKQGMARQKWDIDRVGDKE